MTDDTQTQGDDLQQQLADALVEMEKLKDIAARSQADLQNAKERLERDASDMRKFALQNAFNALLPTIDNFQRALQHLPADLSVHEWVQGIVATEKDLVRTLEGMGLKKMECLGQKADPTVHDILQTQPGETGIIVQVLEDGYLIGDKVLRPAKVIVGDGSAA